MENDSNLLRFFFRKIFSILPKIWLVNPLPLNSWNSIKTCAFPWFKMHKYWILFNHMFLTSYRDKMTTNPKRFWCWLRKKERTLRGSTDAWLWPVFKSYLLDIVFCRLFANKICLIVHIVYSNFSCPFLFCLKKIVCFLYGFLEYFIHFYVYNSFFFYISKWFCFLSL